MTVGPAGFANTTTTTKGKLKVIDWQKWLVQRHYNNQPMTGYGVSIPGGGMQLDRHIQELLDYGIAEPNQIMCDWNRRVIKTLQDRAKKIGFKGQIVEGNMFHVIEDLWDAGKQVDLIDHDNTEFLEDEHLEFLTKACANNVKVYIEVFQTRGNRGGLPDNLLQWAHKLNIQEYRHARGNMAWPWGKIQSRAVEYTANESGYIHYDRAYRGRVSMRSNIMFPNN